VRIAATLYESSSGPVIQLSVQFYFFSLDFYFFRSCSYSPPCCVAGAKEEFAFNPAMCELAGHLLIKEEADFETVNEDQVSDLLHSITRPYYDRVRPQLAALYASQA